MRSGIRLSIGILETILAGVLFVIGWQLPHSDSVEDSFGRVEHVTRNAEAQVRSMREQISELRRKDFPKVASQLRAQTRSFSAKWKDPALDFPTAEAIDATVAESALSLEDWAEALNAGDRISDASPIHRKSDWGANPLARATLHARMALEQCASQLETECRALHIGLAAPMDSGIVIQAMGRVGRIKYWLDRINGAGGNRLANLREATAELESSLDTAHRQVEQVSSAAIPLVIPNGSSPPVVQMTPLWPEGKQVARTLGQASAAVKQANRQLDDFARLLRALYPQNADRGPEIAPASMAMLIDGPHGMRSLANALRSAVDSLERTLPDWPKVARSMQATARTLRGSPQLDGLVWQRSEYERAFRDSRKVTETAEELVQTYSRRIDVRLGEQEQSLAQMESGLSEASAAIPSVSNTAVDLLNAIRWMFLLVGGLVGLHGAFVICEARSKHARDSHSV